MHKVLQFFAYVIMVLFVLLFCVLLANAKWNGVPGPHHKWYEQQYNSQGQWCCNEADGETYEGGYSFDKDGNVILQLPSGPHKIPKPKVLTNANPTGHAIWWHLGATDFCFAPGTLS